MAPANRAFIFIATAGFILKFSGMTRIRLVSGPGRARPLVYYYSYRQS